MSINKLLLDAIEQGKRIAKAKIIKKLRELHTELEKSKDLIEYRQKADRMLIIIIKELKGKEAEK